MLDYGYRSACCKAPIRLGKVKTRSSRVQVKVWVCTKCRSRDINILPKGEVENQAEEPLVEDI